MYIQPHMYVCTNKNLAVPYENCLKNPTVCTSNNLVIPSEKVSFELHMSLQRKSFAVLYEMALKSNRV